MGTRGPSRVDTRQRILDAAAELFARTGVRAVGVNEIWFAAGVAKSTLYQHFRSKDELVAAVIRQRDEAWCARLRSAADQAADPRDMLLAIFGLLDREFADPAYRGSEFLNAAAEFPDADHPVRRAVREHKVHLLDYLGDLAAAAGAVDARALANDVLTLADGAVAARVTRGDLHAARSARRAAATLTDAALGPAQPRRATAVG